MIFAAIWVISYFVIFGWANAENAAFWAYAKEKNPIFYRQNRNEGLGFCLFWSGLAALFGPLGILMTFCLTGFAQHGWSLEK